MLRISKHYQNILLKNTSNNYNATIRRFAGFNLITFPQLSVLSGQLRDYFFNYDNDSLS